MRSLVKHHESDDGTSPNINWFGIGRFVKYLGCHIKKGTALSFDIFGRIEFEFGGESEIDYFDGGEIVVIGKQYVF